MTKKNRYRKKSSFYNYCCNRCYYNDCCGYCNFDIHIHINNYYPPTPSPPINEIVSAETFQYTTVSDGVKTEYRDQDQIPHFSTSNILNPNDISYTNLYINGILQPTTTYTVQKGSLQLLVDEEDLPRKGVPIILQFIKILSK